MNKKSISLFLAAIAAPTFVFAQEKSAYGELIFEDDFERSESQEEKDEPGNGWGTNSKSRAKGDKQVDLKEGAMYIYISPRADHGVSVTQVAEFQDGTVQMRFMLEKPKDSLGLNFADKEFKEVHAGHLCAARISIAGVKIEDLKTGKMNLETRTARQAGTLSDEKKAALKSKEELVKNELKPGKWYDLICTIEGETMTVSIDGKEIHSFSSEGIAHPTKRMLRLAVPKDAVVDDVKIWKAK